MLSGLSGRGIFWRVAGLFRPYWRSVAIVGALLLITASIGVVNPLLIRVVFDTALFPSEGGPDLELLWVIVGVMAAVAVANGVFGVSQTYQTHRVGQHVMRDLRDTLYRHLQGMSMRFFSSTRTGEVQSRVSNDVAGVQTVVDVHSVGHHFQLRHPPQHTNRHAGAVVATDTGSGGHSTGLLRTDPVCGG